MTNRGDQRYLRNGSAGGLTKNVGWAILIILGHAAVLLSFCLLVGWPLGRLVGASVFHREFTDEPVRAISFGRRDWVPSAILSIAALAAAGLAGLGRLMTSSNLLLRVAMWIAIAAGAGVLIPIVIPWAVIEVRHLLSSAPGPGTTAQHTLTLAGISASTLLGWIWALAKGRVKRRLPYLGGIALALLLLIVVGLMVQSSAFYRDSWLDVGLCIWLSVAGGLLLLFTVPGIQWASFRPIYTGGLRQSFSPRNVSGGLPTWSALAPQSKPTPNAPLPELIVCCAAQRVGLSQNGVPAVSFTVTPAFVTFNGTDSVPTDAFTATIRSTKLGRTLEDPAGWMAISGAAFASAMGRSSVGTTNAVFAGLGINLGAWVPSPRFVHRYELFPMVRMTYYLKEIFGIYAPKDDFTFVSDGGHWENLGLAELLRRSCPLILCFDASGDEPGSFNTLREAMSLCLTELPNVREFDLGALAAASAFERGMLPKTSVFEIPVVFTNGDHGRIIYANSRIAADQVLGVRRFAQCDPKFPHYSTGDQFLDDQQFAFLVQAGRDAAAKVRAKI